MVFTILIAGVSAETYINGQQVDDTVTVFDFLGSIFNPTPFSIVGDNRLCGSGTDREPNKQISKTITSNTELNYDCGDAGCSNCLIQVFSGKPLGEYKDNVGIVISIQSGTTKTYRFDFYCCPHPECSSNSQCQGWYGSGSECIRATANDADIDYESSHYHYCSNTGAKASCWYLPSGNSNCVLKEYPGQSVCPASYSGMKLFSQESACNSQSSITSCSQITEDDTGKKLKVSGLCSVEGTYKCIDSDLYTCTDFQSNLGKCWYGGYLSSPKSGCTPCSSKSQSDCDKFVDCKWVSPAAGFPGSCQSISGSTNPCSIGLNWCPDGTCQSNCVGHGKPGTGDGNGGTVGTTDKVDSLTFNEYYSTGDSELLKSGCNQDTDCKVVDGYEAPTCLLDKSAKKRLFNGYKQNCEEAKGSILQFTPGLNLIIKVYNALIFDDCKLIGGVQAWIDGDTGVCVVKSKSWYGKLWDKLLNTIGGLGLPGQYVMLAAWVAIILVIIIALNLIK